MRFVAFIGLLTAIGCSKYEEQINTEPCTDLVPERFKIVRNTNNQMDERLFSYGASPLSTFDTKDNSKSIQSILTGREVNNRSVSIVCSAPSIILFQLHSNNSGDLLHGMEGFYILSNNQYSKGPFLSNDFKIVIQADVDAI